MTKQEYRLYINSEEWRERRSNFLKIWNFCNRCDLPRWLANVAYDQDLNVHHRHYRTIGNEGPEDLEALCKRCHEIESFGHSALRAIHPVPCATCGGPNYDYYSSVCSKCCAIADYRRAELFRDRPTTAVIAISKGECEGKVEGILRGGEREEQGENAL